MSGFTPFLRALAAPALRAPFVLGFALPVMLIPSVIRLSFGLWPEAAPDEKSLWLIASFLLDPLLWSVVSIAWCRTLMRPLDYPRPLVAIRSQPLFRFLAVSLSLVAIAFGLRAGLSLVMPPDYLFLLLLDGLAGLVVVALLQSLQATLAYLPILVFGVALPGVALSQRNGLRAPLRHGLRHVGHLGLVALCVALLQTLALIGLTRFLTLFLDHPQKDMLTTLVPQFMSPTLFTLNMFGKAVINTLSALVLLAALCGEYVRFREKAQETSGEPAPQPS